MTTSPTTPTSRNAPLFFLLITDLPLGYMPVPNSLQKYAVVLLLFLFFCCLYSFTENILNHIPYYTECALRNKSELIMRDPSLRKYTG